MQFVLLIAAYVVVFTPWYGVYQAGAALFIGTKLLELGGCSTRTRWSICLVLLAVTHGSDVPHRIAIDVTPTGRPGLYPIKRFGTLPVNCFFPYVQNPETLPPTLSVHGGGVCVNISRVAPDPYEDTFEVTIACNYAAFTVSRQVAYREKKRHRLHKGDFARVDVIHCLHGQCEETRIFSEPSCT